jgi:hypothetical protein
MNVSILKLKSSSKLYLGTLVGTLLQLSGVGSLLDEIEKALGELLVGQGVGSSGVVGHGEYALKWVGFGGRVV